MAPIISAFYFLTVLIIARTYGGLSWCPLSCVEVQAVNAPEALGVA